MRTFSFIMVLSLLSFVSFGQKKGNTNKKNERMKNPDMSVLGKEGTFYFTEKGDTNEIIPQEKYSQFSLGANFGIGYYAGDIPMDAAWPAYGFWGKYSFSHITSLRLGYMHSKITGSSGTDTTSFFTGRLNSFHLQTLFNLGNVDFRKSFPRNNFYFGIGVGVLNVNSQKDFLSTQSPVKENVIYVPLSLGARRRITNAFDFALELNYGLMAFDRMDLNTSGGLPDGNGSVVASIHYNIVSKGRPKHIDWSNPVEKIYRDLLKAQEEAAAALKRDGDGDGVPDAIDVEPNTKPGFKVDSKGKTLDSDDDGIPDSIDPDPYGFGKALSLYFPNMKPGVGGDSTKSILEFNDSIPKDEFVVISESNLGLPTITFPPNGFTVHVEQYGLLQQIARIMIIDTSTTLMIIGHADNNKPDMTQLTLAEKRALEVKRKLYRIYEIDDSRLLVFSEKDPYVQKYHLNTEGLNRKVEFRILRPRERQRKLPEQK